MNRERDAHDHFPSILPTASRRRLSSQIGRAFRGVYGARSGLRTILRAVAAEMLAAGATAGLVTRALETCVRYHPARIGCDPHSLMSGRSHSAMLVELASECVADVAKPETDAPNPAAARTAAKIA